MISDQLAGEFDAATAAEETVEFEVGALDPYRLRARWNAPADRLAAAQAALGGGTPPAPLALRFHHGGNGAPPYDVFLPAAAGERTFAFRRGGATYRVEFGLLRPDGAIHPLAGDITVATPPAAPSPRDDLLILDLGRRSVFDAAFVAVPKPCFVEYPAPPGAGVGIAPASLVCVPLAHGSGAPDFAAPPGSVAPWP